jgi:molybdopterin synthase catalytic subunit
MVSIVETQIDISRLVSRVQRRDCGALCLFIGTTRNHSNGRPVEYLEYEVYESMAVRQLAMILEEAKGAGRVRAVAVVHRRGKVPAGEASIGIAVSSAHRGDSFTACRYIIDRIKEEVTIWKKEYYSDGTAEWSGGHPTENPSPDIIVAADGL